MHDSNPLISVLITLYNRDKYISEAIQSVLNSKYENYELIIVDDCSTDKSYEIAKQYESKNDKIKLYKNSKNVGDYNNRNIAASYAKGKYLKYLDADDTIYPYGLNIFVESMELYPDAALGISQEVLEDNTPYPFLLKPYDSYKREFLQRGVLNLGPTGTIIKKEIFDKIGGFSGKRHVSDYELWLKIARKFDIVKIQSGLIYWRRHPEQEFTKGQLIHLPFDYLLKINMLKMKECPLNKEECEKASKKIKFRHARNIINLVFKKHKPLKAFNIFIETKFHWIWLIRAILPFKNEY